jgi:tetratricopeptide (TPR) repeat protein
MNKLTALFFAASITAGSLTAQSSINNQLWNDPTFVNEFLGSYGFLAGAEPQITDEEKEALRNLIDLIKASPKAAIQALEPQISKTSSAAFDFILANLYFQDGNLAKAEQYYGNAVVKHPDFRRAYKNLGLVQVQKGDFDKAIKTISKAMELGEVGGRSYGLLGYGYLTQERYYPAEVAYRQAILMQPDVTDWKVGLARCLLETERYADAIALFETLLLDEPNNADYWMLQANAYLGKGESITAAKNLEMVRRMGAADVNTLTLLGDIYMNNESPDLALDAYLGAAEKANSGDSKALLRAAELLTRSGNYEQSKSMIAQIRSQLAGGLSDNNDLKLLTLEAKIARAEGNDEAAVNLLNKIVERDALNGDALIELANFYVDQGEMAKAINRFEQAEKIEAFERDALIAHAQARVRNGEYVEAVPLLRRALQLKSDSNLEDYAQRVEKAAKSQS